MIYTICLSLILFSCAVTLSYFVLTILSSRKKKLWFGSSTRLPRVSILKPIKHGDDELAENLESFFRLDYPDFEMIFGIDSIEEETDAVIEDLRKRYPQVPVSVVPVGKEKILNPKVETLIAMEKHASGQLYWISDANTRAEPDTLRNLVHEHIVNGSKIVFSPIRGMGARTFGSMMENAYLNFYISGNILGSWLFIKRPVVVGKSMLVERASLAGLGGFEYFKQFLAEDYVMGKRFSQNNLYVSTNSVWITNINTASTISEFCARISRWSKMRFHVEKAVYAGEQLSTPVGLALLSCLVLGANGLELLGWVLLYKIVLEYINFFVVNKLDRTKWRSIVLFPACVVLKDLIVFVIYFIPFFNAKVIWRGKHIRIGADSKIFVEENSVGTKS